MPFIATDPHSCLGDVLDTGHCMRHVQLVAGVTHSSTLRAGVPVRGNDALDAARAGAWATIAADRADAGTEALML